MKKFVWAALLGVSTTMVSGTTLAATAEEVYKGSCAVCHDQGVGGAPKMGDKAAWAPRVKQGKDALYKVSISGKPGTAMVAKGGNAKLTDAEVKSVVDLMIARATK